MQKEEDRRNQLNFYRSVCEINLGTYSIKSLRASYRASQLFVLPLYPSHQPPQSRQTQPFVPVYAQEATVYGNQ
jgi:hypothetical protein